VASNLDTLAWVHRARGDLNTAANILKRAVKAEPRDPMFHYHLGIVQTELGRKGEAEASLKRALEIDSKFRGADDARQRLEKLAAVR
jgi:Flp pilus assembly protein TadD